VLALAFLMQPSDLHAQGIVVDHTSLGLFDRIPDQYLQAARNLRFLFMVRSVGANTNDALSCLTATSYGTSPSPCRQDYQFVNGSPGVTARGGAPDAAGRGPPTNGFPPATA